MNKAEKIAAQTGFPFVVYQATDGVRAMAGTLEQCAGVDAFEFEDDSNTDDLSIWPEYLHACTEVIIEVEGEEDEVLVF